MTYGQLTTLGVFCAVQSLFSAAILIILGSISNDWIVFQGCISAIYLYAALTIKDK